MIKKQTRIKALIIPAVFVLAFIFAPEAQAEDHYVDCSRSTNGNGTYASPWNNIPSVNSHTFGLGEDLYFRVNTTCSLNSPTDRLRVKWSGSSSNRVIIGCYDAEGDFDCGATELADGNRAIMDGKAHYPATEQGVIDIDFQSYITIQEIKIINAGGPTTGENGKGIDVRDSTYINVDNCYMYRTYGACLLYGEVKHGLVTDNYCAEVGYPWPFFKGGAAIEISGLNEDNGTEYITVARNKVINGVNEGIGLYKKVSHSIVEHNIVRDIRSYMIYIDAGQYNIIRHNLVYESTENIGGFGQSTNGITINNESERPYQWSGYNEVYGNLISGQKRGISFGCGNEDWVCHEETKVYNNTIIDSALTQIMIWNPNAMDGFDIKNNLSYFSTATSATHVTSYGSSYVGQTWSHNLFYGNALPTGIPATSAVFGDPKLTKASGWRALAPDSISGNHFKLLSASAAINKGTSLASAYNKDYFGTLRPQGTGWDIGAHEYATTSGAINILPLGDSITENAPTKSYRFYLWSALKGKGYDVNFVGTKKTQIFDNFDPDHEGHSGFRADEIAAKLPDWLKSYKPDTVLLHIGLNDFFQNESVANVVGDIENIISILQSNNPKVTILLSKLMLAVNTSLKREQLNAEIPAIASRKTTELSKIYVVNNNEGFSAATDTYDGTHPNEIGNEKISNKWFETLKISMSKYLCDFNKDGKVDIADYSMFIQDFGKTGTNLAADLNKNGKVEIGDYSIFISNFGKSV